MRKSREIIQPYPSLTTPYTPSVAPACQHEKAGTLGMLITAMMLIAALSLVSVPEAISAQSPTPVMSTQIQVTARVLARASIRPLKQPTAIVVTDADIRRGYLDINAAFIAEIRNNSRAGVNLIFETGDLPFKEILVSGFGKEVALRTNGGIITHQVTGTNIVSFNYRFIFNKDSQAGTYEWPFSVSVSPVE